MSQRVQPGKDETEDVAHARLDNSLQVRQWRTPWQEAPEPAADLEDGAPWWWAGDEEASQSVLAAYGVTL